MPLSAACSCAVPNKGSAQEQDIVDTAIGAGVFNTLVTAISAADLVAVLKSDGPFTVFAPTDDAFAALPEGTIESLLEPENKEQLVAILLYHVVAGKVLAEEVLTLGSAPTAQGQDVSITLYDSGVMVDNANVVETDVLATNGVIHIIDAVILPILPTLVETGSGWGGDQAAVGNNFTPQLKKTFKQPDLLALK